VARYKQRARELKQDAFRDATVSLFERLGDWIAARRRTVIYAVGAIVILVLVVGLWGWWSARRADEAQKALGEAIRIAQAPIGDVPAGYAGPKFANRRERAQRAAEEFQKVAARYGEPYRDKARYLAAVNLLEVDRARGLGELEALSKSGNDEIAAWAKFALAQAREADGQLDAALALYRELADARNPIIPPDDAKLRIAEILYKQGKRQEASDLLFRMVEAARTARDRNGKPIAQSDAVRAAAERLQAIDPDRYAQLPPEPPVEFPVF
jgi:tetratricopeptide (TPR) repeat protein